jgi:3-hydroxybutyryl-CoA dehydrogenase
VSLTIPTTIAFIGATPNTELIALRALRAGVRVIIDDVSDVRLQSTALTLSERARADDQFDPLVFSLGLPYGLTLTQSIESAIRAADFLIDTLPDDLEVKLELFTLFDKFAKPNAIFITTGSIPIDDLAGITFCPDRCVAVHLTAAANESETTFRLVSGTQTSPQTLAASTSLFAVACNFPASKV